MKALSLESIKFTGGFLQHLVTLNASGILLLITIVEKFGPGIHRTLTLQLVRPSIICFYLSLAVAFAGYASISMALLLDPASLTSDLAKRSDSDGKHRRQQPRKPSVINARLLFGLAYCSATIFFAGLIMFAWPFFEIAD